MTERYFPIHQIPQLRDALRTDEMEVQGTGGGASARVLASSVSALGGQPGPTGPAGPTMIKSPYDFGAVGNGIADDTVAVQAWLDSCIPNGGILYGKPGTFLIRSQSNPHTPGDLALLISGNTTIWGAGKDLFVLKTDSNQAQDYGLLFNKTRVVPPGIQSVTIANGGTGYAQGDTGYIHQAALTSAQYIVASVGGSGAITGVVVTSGNDPLYTTANGLSLVNAAPQPGSGSGATVNIASNGVTTRVDKNINIYGVGFEGHLDQVSTNFQFVGFYGVDGLNIRDCGFRERSFDALDIIYGANTDISYNEFSHTGDPRFNTSVLTSLTSVGTTATAVSPVPLVFITGSLVDISGATPGAYNGTYSVTVINSTTFTYTFAGGVGPATGATCHGSSGNFNGGTAIFFQTTAEETRVTNNNLFDNFGGGIWLPAPGGPVAPVQEPASCVCTGNTIIGACEFGITGIPSGSTVSDNVIEEIIRKDVSGHGIEAYGDNQTFTGNVIRFCDATCAVFSNPTNLTVTGNVFDLANQQEAPSGGAVVFLARDPWATTETDAPNNVVFTGNMISGADEKCPSAIQFAQVGTDPNRKMNNIHVCDNNFGPAERWTVAPITYSPDADTVIGTDFIHRNNNGNTDCDPYQSSHPITIGQSGTTTITGVPFRPRTLDLISNIASNSIMSQCVGPVNNAMVNNSSSISSDSNGFVSTVGTGIKLYDGTPTLLLDAAVTSFTNDGFVITFNSPSGTNAEVIFTAYP